MLAGAVGSLIPGPETYFTDFDHFVESKELNEEEYPLKRDMGKEHVKMMKLPIDDD
jgi:hypothetical protein